MISIEKISVITAAAMEAGLKTPSIGDLLFQAEIDMAEISKLGGIDDWLKKQKIDNPAWFGAPTKPETPPSPKPPAPQTEENPFASATWNMTRQGQLYKADPAKAEKLAKLAGTTIGGLPPKAPTTPTTPSRDSAGRFLPSGEPNPFAPETWNLTAQGAFLRKHGLQKAEEMAKLAGTTLGAPRPQPAQERPIVILRRRPLQLSRPQTQKPE